MNNMTGRDAGPDVRRRRLLKAGLALAGGAAVGPGLSGCGKASKNPVPGDAAWRNWSGSQVSAPRAWLNPRDEAELAAQMRAASGTLRVTGASHSFSALCNTDDTLFSLDHLSGVVSHDVQTLQATVWAGTRLRDLGGPLWDRGQALSNQGDVDPQSVGGACGTSTHGTGITLGSFSSMVRGVRLVTPQGEIVEADAEHDAEVFQAAATSLGALGIASQIRLQNRAPYKLHEREFLEDLPSVLSKLDAYVRDNRHFEFWAFFETDRAIVKLLNETAAEDTPPPSLELPVDHVLDLASEIAHNVGGMDGAMQKLLTVLHTDSERVGRAHAIFPTPRNSRFNEMEYELPAAKGPECLMEILETVRKSGIRTLFPVEYRTVAADTCWLSPFYDRDTASISVHQYHKVDYRELFDLVEPIFWKYEGRPHWGKLHRLEARQLAPLYPRWDDFRRVRERLDPAGRMLSAHLRRLLVTA
jgi:FAD-linked oxidoreductase|nr:D-arabinono-1,4-lactone oxidase [Panacagrimonas sp.]